MAKTSEESEKLVKTKSISNSCHFCNKKLKLIHFSCKCLNNFCIQHKYPDSHNCTFDYKAEGKEQLKKANPIINSEKIKDI